MSLAYPGGNNPYHPQKDGVKILIVTGASGGHIFPALAFLEALNVGHDKALDALLILPQTSKGVPLTDCGCSVKYLCMRPVRLRPSLENLAAVAMLFGASLESILILLRFRPDVVVGFGSLVSVPLVVFSRVMGFKTLIHEQNVIPGRANKFLARFAGRIAVSFGETKDYLKRYQQKIVFTGNPIRQGLAPIEKSRALEFFGFSDTNPTLLVMGGSQGSHRINTCFLKVLPQLSGKSRLQIIHLTGSLDFELLSRGYRDLGVEARLFVFLEAMQYAYSACDFVLSRAGATTINELVHFRIPGIIIPYPYAYKHQAQNARVLADKGVVRVINDDDLDTGRLRDTIDELLDNPGRIKEMASRYVAFPRVDASALLREAAMSEMSATARG